MLESFQNAFRIPELRKRILFTLALLAVYRIGGQIPTPGIDHDVLASFFSRMGGTIFGLYNLFVGGAFERATIFALGVMPYISASIVLQLLGSMVPFLQKLQKEGQEGQKKINQYTRYGTVGLAVVQAWGISIWLESIADELGRSAVIDPGFSFQALTILTMTTGTVFLMWLGEQIQERGIGNGISLIIFVGIIAQFPIAIQQEVEAVMNGLRPALVELVLVVIWVLIIASIVLITQGQRRIVVQYPRRVVGRKVYGGQSTHLPLKVNAAGVMPIIFAQSIMFAPGTLSTFWPESTAMQTMSEWFQPGAAMYDVFYGLLIVFFTYFYTAIIFNPVDVADNMKRVGGFVPGIRPGKRTADYLDRILTRITLPGAIFLAFIAVVPFLIIRSMNVSISASSFFGGTSLLIVVGVALDTLQQIESHLVMRHYEGFMRRGKVRGRA
ncbi:MAG: preprotein translocase subunit SecY [Candidatus Latescibacteria bacterium]|jgi:preprotein translocase subunit SecY|nr:preprotein translocase subunit SecY [Candidatus Latescibacterota bacterium]